MNVILKIINNNWTKSIQKKLCAMILLSKDKNMKSKMKYKKINQIYLKRKFKIKRNMILIRKLMKRPKSH